MEIKDTTIKIEILQPVTKELIISAKDIEFVCKGAGCDDDACAYRIKTNYDIDEDAAWKIVDILWDKYGREY